jgi:CheY-like chemotaxis protein
MQKKERNWDMADGAQEEEYDGRLIDILLVDDNDSDVAITLRAFNKLKIKSKVHVVNDGQEALDYIHHRGKYHDKEKFPRPDLILLDINMPKLDGFGVLNKLKSEPKYNYIPIIMLTSSRAEEDIVKSYKDGAASFIPKPINYDDFVKVVKGMYSYWQKLSKLPKPEEI